MLSPARSMMLLGLVACAPLPEGTQTSETRDPASSGDAAATPAGDAATAAPTNGSDGGPTSDYLAACSNACIKQAVCVGLTAFQCRDQCEARAGVLAEHTCTEAAIDEMTCLASLSCSELQSYASVGRRDDPHCGQFATAYFAECTLGGGAIPEACANLCTREAFCDSQNVSPAACEEDCVLRATSADWEWGSGCSTAFLSLADCLASASCDALALLHEEGQTPAACSKLEARLAETCQ